MAFLTILFGGTLTICPHQRWCRHRGVCATQEGVESIFRHIDLLLMNAPSEEEIDLEVAHAVALSPRGHSIEVIHAL